MTHTHTQATIDDRHRSTREHDALRWETYYGGESPRDQAAAYFPRVTGPYTAESVAYAMADDLRAEHVISDREYADVHASLTRTLRHEGGVR